MTAPIEAALWLLCNLYGGVSKPSEMTRSRSLCGCWGRTRNGVREDRTRIAQNRRGRTGLLLYCGCAAGAEGERGTKGTLEDDA